VVGLPSFARTVTSSATITTIDKGGTSPDRGNPERGAGRLLESNTCLARMIGGNTTNATIRARAVPQSRKQRSGGNPDTLPAQRVPINFGVPEERMPEPERLGGESLPARRSNDTRASRAAVSIKLALPRFLEEPFMLATNQDILQRIRMEYIEMPDLRLTLRQARRLWNLEAAVCDELLGVLLHEGFLARANDGAFLRRGDAVSVQRRPTMF
jgi:hypothetical protein